MIAKKSTHNEYVILSKYIIGYSFLSFKVEKREPTDPNSHKRINTKKKKNTSLYLMVVKILKINNIFTLICYFLNTFLLFKNI